MRGKLLQYCSRNSEYHLWRCQCLAQLAGRQSHRHRQNLGGLDLVAVAGAVTVAAAAAAAVATVITAAGAAAAADAAVEAAAEVVEAVVVAPRLPISGHLVSSCSMTGP